MIAINNIFVAYHFLTTFGKIFYKTTMKKIALIAVALLVMLPHFILAQDHVCTENENYGGIVYYPKNDQTDNLLNLEGYTIKGKIIDEGNNPILSPVRVLNFNKEGEDEKPVTPNKEGKFSVKINIDKSYPAILMIEEFGFYPMHVAVSPQYHKKEIIIQLKRKNRNKITVKGNTTTVDIKELRVPSQPLQGITAGKPAIYLYPEKETRVEIKHTFKGKVLTTYPDYGEGWEVIAKTDGKLLNLKDNRNYDYLFWDGYCQFPASTFDYKEGFYVSKKDYTSFLLNKLTHIGLNETETNDFIVYWLPILNEFDRVFIHFRVNDDIRNTSQLNITPKPDTMIRVFMEFKKDDGKSKNLPEQKLPSCKREKFTLLEWGGGNIGSERVK